MHSIRPSGSTLSILVLGLFLFGLGDAVIISADWGVTPWTVLADGISFMMGTSIGTATFLVSMVVLLLWIPLRERPGVGTVRRANTPRLYLVFLGGWLGGRRRRQWRQGKQDLINVL